MKNVALTQFENLREICLWDGNDKKTREETKRLIKSKFGINEEESPMGKNSISVAFITLWRNII